MDDIGRMERGARSRRKAHPRSGRESMAQASDGVDGMSKAEKRTFAQDWTYWSPTLTLEYHSGDAAPEDAEVLAEAEKAGALGVTPEKAA